MSNLHSNKNKIRILKGFLNKDSVIPSRHQEWFFTEINPYIILALIITEGDSIYSLYESYCKYKNKSSKKKQDHTEAFIYAITELPYAIFNKITIEKLNKSIQTMYSRWKKKLADPNRSINKDIHMMSEYHKLNEIHKKQIVAQCHRVNIIKPIVSSLDNTLLQFVDCPIRFISNNNLKGGLNIILLKNVLRLLQNSGTTSSVITLATALYICATVGSVAVLDRDLKFEDVLDYPATDKSLLAASCIRSTHNALFAINRGDFTQQWQRSFWQTCLLIEPFTITNLEDDAP